MTVDTGPDIDQQLEAQQIEAQRERIRGLTARRAGRRILSTLPFSKTEFWAEHVETVPAARNLLSPLTERVGIPDLSILFKLAAKAHEYDLVLLTGGERIDLLYLAVAGLLPWVRTPHVIVGAHWQKAEGLGYLVQKLLLRLGRRLTAEVQPQSTEEVAIYAEAFGVPTERLNAIPWSTSLGGHDVSPATAGEVGPYILTGGLSFRDYYTLFEAIKGTDLRLEVGLPDHPSAARIVARGRQQPNVDVHTDWSNAQFVRKMAGCRFFALPIEPGLTRCTGDQTILNAMYFGKIVVATDSIGARVYIKDGVNGFLVPEGSVEAWKEALTRVSALDEDQREAIGRRAAYDARVLFNEPLRLVRTLEAALDAGTRYARDAGATGYARVPLEEQ
jgi:glycosyltransferase involved in cell wall biosynthesis